jgi:hypothetical protein
MKYLKEMSHTRVSTLLAIGLTYYEWVLFLRTLALEFQRKPREEQRTNEEE